MFDDHQKTPSGNIPPNLPSEPADMFAETEKAPAGAPAIPNALDAGLLKPKQSAPPRASTGAFLSAATEPNTAESKITVKF